MVELLYFEGCPNHESLLPRLRELIVQAGVDTELELRRVESPEAAERERFLGSPTVRVDGRDVDPGSQQRDDFGFKCRLYRTDEGLVGVPPDEWVLAALRGEQPESVGGTNAPPTEAGAAMEALGIAPEPFARNRAAGLGAEDRALYRSILEGFSSGAPPTATGLVEAAGAEDGENLRSRLRRLQAADLVELDGDGELILAYPFSARPTLHRVSTVDGRGMWACCAIDALGIPSMLGVAATIHSREPDGGAEVEVSVEPAGEPSWEPRDAVVLVAGAGRGSTACCACPHINFFVSPASADRHLAARPELSGKKLSVSEATTAGRGLFGELLAELAT